MTTSPSSDPDQSVITAHLEHLTVRALAESTKYQRRRVLARLRQALDGLGYTAPLLAADRLTMERWQAESIAHLTPGSRHTECSHVRAFFAWAVRYELIDADPTLRLAEVKVPPRLPRPIEGEAAAKALREAPERIRPWLALALHGGLRACEIANLTRECLITQGGQRLLIVTGKGGRQRIVPCSDALWDELQPLPLRGFLFPRGDGMPGPNRAWTVSQKCSAYLRYHGLGTLHCLRHTAGTEWLGESHDLRVVQELLGHASPNTTAIYTAFSREESSRCVLAVSEKWAA